MRLKEAFTLQNKISNLYQQAIRMLRAEVFSDKKVIHMYSKAHIGEDATEALPVDVDFLAEDVRYEFDKLVDLAQNILADKQRLTMAIEEAKANCGVSIDALKQGNVVRQSLINSLSNLETVKSFQVDGEGQVYGKDNEGKPAVYRYPTRTITTYNFNKAHLKSILKHLKEEFEEVSLKLDELSLSVNVNFVPTYDYDSRLEQIYLGS